LVIAQQDKSGDTRLLAYFLVKDPSLQKESGRLSIELRQHLMKKLPLHMIPSHFIMLEKFPLTSNGKIDRRALPAPTEYERNSATPFVAARDENERKLAALWTKVLNLKEIGVNDNFFELGGDSLVVIQLLGRIEETFHQKISLKAFLTAPTIAGVAELLKSRELTLSAGSGSIKNAIVAIQEQGSQPPLILIHAPWGLIKYERALGSHLPKLPIYGIHNPKLGEKHEPFRSIEEMAAYYVRMLKTFKPAPVYRLGGWSMGGIIAFEMARQLSQENPSSVESVLLIDTFNTAKMTATYREINQSTARQNQSIIQLLKREGIDPESETGELLAQELKNNMKLLETYVPGKTSTRVILLKAQIPMKRSQDTNENPVRTYLSPEEQVHNGWRECVERDNLIVHLIPDDHISMFTVKEHVKPLAEMIEKALNQPRKPTQAVTAGPKPVIFTERDKKLVHERDNTETARKRSAIVSKL